jgi:hypothetical protein
VRPILYLHCRGAQHIADQRETDQRAYHQPDIFEKHVLHYKNNFLEIIFFRVDCFLK